MTDEEQVLHAAQKYAAAYHAFQRSQEASGACTPALRLEAMDACSRAYTAMDAALSSLKAAALRLPVA